jgi:O-antigen ligase
MANRPRRGPGATRLSAPATGAAAVAAPRPQAITLVRWALYAFIFSLPFDAPGKLPLELTTMTGAGFLAATLLQPRLCFGYRPRAVWWFLGYLYAYWIAYLTGGARSTPDAIRSSLFYVQGLLIFIACFNLMRDPKIARRVLITLAIAAVVLGVMTILGIGKLYDTESGRVTVFGQNANRAARVLCAGVLTLVGLVYGRPRPALRPAWIAWPAAALVCVAMIMGGSRGGLLAMAFGLWMFSLSGNSLGIRIRNTAVALIAIGLAAWGALQSPVMQRRIELAQQGNMAQRQIIFPTAFQMFKDKPLIGWGPSNQYVLATRLGLPPALHLTRDTHNLVLEALTATGLLGSIPYFTGLWLCCWGAWKARRGWEGILPAAQMVSLAAGNMSGNYIVLKLQWVLLAYAMASWVYLTPRWAAAPVAARRRR